MFVYLKRWPCWNSFFWCTGLHQGNKTLRMIGKNASSPFRYMIERYVLRPWRNNHYKRRHLEQTHVHKLFLLFIMCLLKQNAHGEGILILTVHNFVHWFAYILTALLQLIFASYLTLQTFFWPSFCKRRFCRIYTLDGMGQERLWHKQEKDDTVIIERCISN